MKQTFKTAGPVWLNGLEREKILQPDFEYMSDRTGTLWKNQTDHASCNHGFASYAAVFILKAQENSEN